MMGEHEDWVESLKQERPADLLAVYAAAVMGHYRGLTPIERIDALRSEMMHRLNALAEAKPRIETLERENDGLQALVTVLREALETMQKSLAMTTPRTSLVVSLESVARYALECADAVREMEGPAAVPSEEDLQKALGHVGKWMDVKRLRAHIEERRGGQ